MAMAHVECQSRRPDFDGLPRVGAPRSRPTAGAGFRAVCLSPGLVALHSRLWHLDCGRRGLGEGGREGSSPAPKAALWSVPLPPQRGLRQPVPTDQDSDCQAAGLHADDK